MFLPKSKKLSTFLKYLISYILVFTVLMAAFFLILRTQLTEAYSSQRTARIQSQMASVCAHLRDEFLFLAQIDNLIAVDPDVKLATYRREGKYYHVTGRELCKYSSASNLIDIIVYHSHYNGYTYASSVYITYADGVFTLKNPANHVTVFDPAPYMDANAGQLVWLQGENTEYLLYFPQNRTGAKYIYFYILDTKVIQSQLKGLLSEEVPAVALLDVQGNYVTGSGFEAFASQITEGSLTPGTQPLSEDYSLFLSESLHSGFSIATVVSEDHLADQVDRAFMRAFFSLLGLSLLGIGVVYVAMLFTYRPLKRLVKKLGHEAGRHQNYLELISDNYSQLSQQKEQLENSLAEYRKSLAQYRQQRAYPNDTLGRLSASLKEKRFADARELIETLLVPSDSAPDYFLSCIVLDCLTLITNSMSQAHIEFNAYSEVFTEAVRQCRNIQYIRNFDELKSLINELLFFYERETVDRLLHTTPLQQMLEANFCDPDFSISVIAGAYHVSDSRMSTLFKDEMGISFKDYIWKMRLEKAQALLRDTELSVEEISLMVGYLSSSSFGRKYKQETGISPTQYRSQLAQEAEAPLE